jgi:nuclear transport factor 2 (NTF2) superfamily protein
VLAVVKFLERRRSRELDKRLIKALWKFGGNRIAARFACESHDDSGNWFRSFGNENWEFRDDGMMRPRFGRIKRTFRSQMRIVGFTSVWAVVRAITRD